MKANFTGFKTEIDERLWRIANAEHAMGPGGFRRQDLGLSPQKTSASQQC
ncbi:hypothetical protein [Croceicoccus ponticola]|nr:hypothetical protein [Croceicoccus ponticola]